MNIWTREHMDIWTYGRGCMDIWAFRQMDVRMCCRDAGYDYKHCFENSYQDCSNKKNTGNFQAFLDFIHLRRFVTLYVLYELTLSSSPLDVQ
jgi:hypothetical protein